MAVELALESVGYRYPGGHQAVSDVGLALGPGIVGLLGPNGAGKSSLMRVLATLSRASRGRVTWRGEDIARKPDALRRELGYLPQDFGVYEALSAREFLAFLAAVKGLPAKAVAARVDECLARILPEIEPVLGERAALANLRALVVHGRDDDKLPVDCAHRAGAWLRALGVPHGLRLYDAGHELTPATARDFLEWFGAGAS